MIRIIAVLSLLLAGPAFAQTAGTLDLVGPSTSPGAPQLTPAAINTAVNAQLGMKADANASSATAATAGGILRTLATRFADTVNIVDYAVCDGTTVATTTMNTAAADAAGHASLMIPAGVTCVTTGLTLPANSTLILNGTILQAPGVASTVAAVIVNGDNVAITGTGTIDGNVSNMTAGANPLAGLGNGGSGGFSGLYVGAITIQNTLNWPFNMGSQSNAIAFGTRFLNGGNSVEYAVSGTNDWFDHVYVSNIADLAVGFYGGVTSSGIVNSYITGGHGAGAFVLMDSGQPGLAHDILIANNIATGNDIGIYVGTSLVSPHPRDVVVEGNDVFSNTVSGINVINTDRTKVSGNWVHSNAYNASVLGDIFINSGAKFSEVTGNTVFNPGQGSVLGCGIYLQITVDAVVSFNTITDDQGTPTMAGGLCGSTGQRTVVLDNKISGSIGAADQIAYNSNSSGSNMISATRRSTVNMDENGLLSFTHGTPGVTTGYNVSGIEFGWNYTGGAGEGDIFIGPGSGGGAALNIYQLDSSGSITGAPIFSLSNTGGVTTNAHAGVSCTGTPTSSFASVGGIVTHC